MKFVLIGVIILMFLSCDSGASGSSKKLESNKTSENILFIGNSLTYRNGGIDKHLNYLLEGTPDHKEEFITRAAKGKYRLQMHWDDPDTRKKFNSKKWDKIILQEYSSGPIRQTADFEKYATRWVNEIRKVNKKTKIYFYSPWNYVDAPLMDDSLNAAYTSLSKRINVSVVPVGLLWKELRSRINLYDSDGGHPNRKGTFVTACLFYERLLNLDVRKTENTDPFLTDLEQTELKLLVHEFNTYSKRWSKNKKDRSS